MDVETRRKRTECIAAAVISGAWPHFPPDSQIQRIGDGADGCSGYADNQPVIMKSLPRASGLLDFNGACPLEPQWLRSCSSAADYDGPAFRRGNYLAASLQEETSLIRHVYRISDNERVTRLSGEREQSWNAAECIDFPRKWADEVIAQSGG